MKCVKFLVASLFNMTKAELQTFLAPKQDGQSNLPLQQNSQSNLPLKQDDKSNLPPQEEAQLFIFSEKILKLSFGDIK